MVVNLRTIATEYLKPPLGEPVKGKNKTTTKQWLEKFYQKTTNLPEPFLHELVERLDKYLDRLEEQLVDLSSFFLYDHRLQEAHLNSSEVLQSALLTHQQVSFDSFNPPLDDYSSQTCIYGGILPGGFFVL